MTTSAPLSRRDLFGAMASLLGNSPFLRMVRYHQSLIALFVVLLTSFVSFLPAQAQILDPTFTFTGPPDGFNAEVRDVIQVGTQLVVVGNFTNYRGTAVNRVARLNDDGTLDGTFVPPGAGVINGQVNSIALDGTGFYIGGQFNNGTQNYVMRLTSTGALDAGFATTAIDNQVRAVTVVGTDVVAVGDFTAPFNRIVRLTNTGAAVGGFNPGTGFTGGNFASAVVVDGTSLIIGGDFSDYNGSSVGRIVRIAAATAAIDATFRTNNGTGFNGDVLTLQMVGTNVLVGGNFTSFGAAARGRIARLIAGTGATRGQNDGTFTTGAGFDAAVNSIAVDGAGRVMAGGGFLNYAGTGRNNIARLTTAGALDILFNPGSGFNNVVNKVLNQTDGKLVVGGRFTSYNTTSSRFRIARFAYASSVYPSGLIFPEVAANDGSSSTQLTLTLGPAAPTAPLDLEEWTASVANGTDFTAGTHYTVSGVPAGMTMAIQKTNNKTATIRLTGNALAHANVNDVISSVIITWQNAALLGNNAAGVEGLNTITTRYSVDFRDPGTAAYSATTFPEDVVNNGTISAVRTITLTNVAFNAGIANGTILTAGGTHYTLGGGPIPAGLTLVITKTGTNTATIALTGAAAPHTAAQDVNFNLTFANAALETGAVAAGVTGLNGVNLSVNFLNPGTAAYSGTTFGEASTNNGAITQTRTITLTGEQWRTSLGVGMPFAAGADYTVANVPAGLTAVVTKTGVNTADISFTGTATAHASANNVANVQFTWAGAAIQSGSIATGLNGVNHSINFNDPGSATYSGTVFPEAAANDGSITQTRTITLTNEEWNTGVANGSPLTNGVHYTIANMPPGLTEVVTKTSANVATISFTGNAPANLPANDVANMQFTFLNPALASNAVGGVTGLNGQNLAVNFINTGSAAYSATMFPEATSNDGAITQTRTITLTNEQWTSAVAVGANLTGAHFTAANVPAGLTAVVTKTSPSVGTISFTGLATAHANADDLANVQLTFTNAAMQSGSAGGVTGLNGQNLSIDFNDPGAGGVYGGTVFTEAGANNGSVTMTNTITLTGEQWRTAVAIGAPLTAGADYTVANVPPGLTMVITKTSANVATISFTGNATNHLAANSVNNVQITFNPAAVASGNLAGLNGQNLDVNFNNPSAGSAAYSGTTFPEVALNNGTITTTRTITLTGDTWVTAVGVGTPLTAGVHYTIANVPPGMTAVLTKTSPTVVTISLTGTATNHAAANSIANMQITFDNSAVNSLNAAATTGLNGQNLAVNFNDPFSAAYSGTTFSESVANDGSIANPRTITLTGETWTAGVAIGGTLLAGTHYNAVNIPAGLVPVLLKTSPTQVSVLLTGNAAPHLAANSVNNAQFTFLNPAVQGGSAAAVAGLNGQNLSVNFLDVPPTGSAVWSGLTYAEAAANDGSVTQTRTVTLTGETWATAIPTGSAMTGAHFTVANVPAGLTMVVTKTSANVATVSFTGNAAAHAAANSLTNIQPTFLNASLQGGVAGAITDLNGQNLSITFINSPPPTAAYSGTVFNEASSNNGTVPDTQVITLTNDTWTTGVAIGAPLVAGTHYSVTNVPAGLTMVLTKLSPTEVRISYTGVAAVHTIPDNVANIQITVSNAGVQGANAAAIAGLNGVNLSINYITGTAVFGNGLTVTGNPDGTVVGTLPIDITGDTFNGTIPNGTVLGPTHYTVTGLPPGITPVITKVSPTQVTVTFTGTANPVPSGAFNNIQISFLPAALTGGDPSVIQGLNGQNLGINFPIATPPTISITSFSPTSGYRGVSVLISGTGFTNASSVRFGNFPAQSFQVLNDSWIRAVLDSTDGNTIQVTSPLGTAQRISFVYTTPPTAPRQATIVTGISPSQFTFGTPVTLSGINFNGATRVLIGGVPVQSFTVNSDGQITAIVGGIPVNDQIQVFTNNPAMGSVPTNFSGFGAQYMRGQPPTLVSVSPNPIRSSGEDIPLALTGINLSPDGRISVQDGTKPPVLVTGSATTPTQATMTLPAELRYPGTQRIIFTNPDGQSSSVPLTITPGAAPTISLTPAISTMATSRPFTIAVSGSGFFPTSQFTLGGIPVTARITSPQTALIDIPGYLNETPRTTELRVTNTDRQSAAVPVTILRRPPPTIMTLESSPTPNDWRLTLRGTNFQPGSVVTLTGQVLDVVSTTGDSLVVARLPRPYTLPSNSTASVMITNPDGQSHGLVLPPHLFQNQGGVISNGSPLPGASPLRVNIPQAITTSATLQPFSRTIIGTGFLPATAVSLDGTPVPITRYISPEQVVVEIPAVVNTPRTTTMRFTNPDGQTASVPVRIDNTPLPYITMVTNIPTPRGTQVVVYGANFGNPPALTVGGVPAEIVGNNDSVVVAFVQTPPNGFDCRTPTPCALTNPTGARAGIGIDAGKMCSPCGGVTTQARPATTSFTTASTPKVGASVTNSAINSAPSSTQQLADLIVANEAASQAMFGNVRIFPNPTSDMVQIEGLREFSDEPVKVRFMDIKGTVIKEARAERSFDVSGFAAGVYCIELSTERGKRWVSKVVVRR